MKDTELKLSQRIRVYWNTVGEPPYASREDASEIEKLEIKAALWDKVNQAKYVNLVYPNKEIVRRIGDSKTTVLDDEKETGDVFETLEKAILVAAE